MERIAVPVFESRVSPLLDSCNTLLVVDFDDGHEIDRRRVSLEKMSYKGRLDVFTRLGIQKIICAGVSDLMCKLLASNGIESLNGKVGEVEKIIYAYCCKTLDQPCFCMPGKQKKENDV